MPSETERRSCCGWCLGEYHELQRRISVDGNAEYRSLMGLIRFFALDAFLTPEQRILARESLVPLRVSFADLLYPISPAMNESATFRQEIADAIPETPLGIKPAAVMDGVPIPPRRLDLDAADERPLDQEEYTGGATRKARPVSEAGATIYTDTIENVVTEAVVQVQEYLSWKLSRIEADLSERSLHRLDGAAHQRLKQLVTAAKNISRPLATIVAVQRSLIARIAGMFPRICKLRRALKAYLEKHPEGQDLSSCPNYQPMLRAMKDASAVIGEALRLDKSLRKSLEEGLKSAPQRFGLQWLDPSVCRDISETIAVKAGPATHPGFPLGACIESYNAHATFMGLPKYDEVAPKEEPATPKPRE
jgi:hypothetical protein